MINLVEGSRTYTNCVIVRHSLSPLVRLRLLMRYTCVFTRAAESRTVDSPHFGRCDERSIGD